VPDMLTYPDLTEVAAAHLRLVTSLHHLADTGVSDADRAPARLGSKVPIHIGDVVVLRTNNRWRRALVTELGCGGDPIMLRAAYLVPSALDAAQNTWTATSFPILADDYPRQQAIAAGRKYGNDVTASPQATRMAYRDAVLAQAIARGLPARPWAAVVAIQYVDRATTNVYVPADQNHNCR